MDIYMPEIYWYDDRKAITCVDIQQNSYPTNRVREFEYNCDRYYKLATTSVTSEVRIWEFCFENIQNSKAKPLKVNFIANLDGHQGAINVCKFSPNGQYLSTGDAFGGLITWYVDENSPTPEPAADYELPPNKENWKQYRKGSIRHNSDVTCLSWSPCSQYLASGSNDDSIVVQDIVNGKILYTLRNFRRFPVGLSWDPRGKFISTFSTDRRLDIIDAKKGHRLRNVFTVEKLKTEFDDASTNPEIPYKLFHDDQLVCFARTIDFSPCGSLLFVPTAHIELPGHNIYGTYVFKRSEFDKLRPWILLPSQKATILVKVCPIVYELCKDTEENFMGLPYRIIFAVMTDDTVALFDTQHSAPFMYIDNLHYDKLTGLAWAPDGKSICVSSLEGYNSIIMIHTDEIGKMTSLPSMEELNGRDSPILKKPKVSKAVKENKDSNNEGTSGGEVNNDTTQKRKTKNDNEKTKKKKIKKDEENLDFKSTQNKKKEKSPKIVTPKTPTLLKFFTPKSKDESPVSTKQSKMIMGTKSNKKIEIVSLDEES